MTTKHTAVDTAKAQPDTVKFSKEALLQATPFEPCKDALGAIIKDGERLSIAETTEKLDTFMKGKVH